jgi:hypothetical protein
MISILTRWLSWRADKKRQRYLVAVERQRNAIVKAMHARKAGHREYKPLLSDLRRATNASLAASTKREREFQAHGGLL